MDIALDSRSSGPGLSPGWGHHVVFLGKRLNSHRPSFLQGVYLSVLSIMFHCSL